MQKKIIKKAKSAWANPFKLENLTEQLRSCVKVVGGK